MKKQEFLRALKKRLSGMKKQDVEERLIFYSEMIDDRMEEGLTEEEAISDIGSVYDVSARIIAETAADGVKLKGRHRIWEIVLLVLGSPIWLSLAAAALAVILSLYVVLWSLIVSAWAIFVSSIASAISGVIASIFFVLDGNGLTGIAMAGAGILCAGLSIFLFLGCKMATKSIIRQSKKIALGIKKYFSKKENA